MWEYKSACHYIYQVAIRRQVSRKWCPGGAVNFTIVDKSRDILAARTQPGYIVRKHVVILITDGC